MNKDKRNNIQLLGTLNNADESGIIANANQVYDANEDKSTQDVSKEHKERIETLETKESSMQTTLENITKTGEASAASNVTYNHNDSKLDASNVQQAIDEVRKRSNYNDGNNIIDFNTVHIITDNPEFICVAVDANDKILYGIKTDGQPYFGIGCPQQVKDYVNEQINKILGTNDITTTIDSLKEIETFLKDFTNSDTLKTLLDTKANKTDVDNTIANVNADIADKYKKSNPNDEEGNVIDTNSIKSVINNPEYFKAFVDNTNKLIEVIGLDGIRKFFAGINIQGTLQCVTDNPEYSIAWVDKENRIIFAIQHDGNPYFGYGVPKQIKTVVDDALNTDLVNKYKFQGKRFAVIGDSISSYRGITKSGYATFYPTGDVISSAQTWWGILRDTLGMSCVNRAWSGSTCTGDSAASAKALAACSTQRILDIGDDGAPDIVICYIGTNDWQSSHQIDLGNWTYNDAIPADGVITEFKPAYAMMLYKIQTYYPNARIFCCTIIEDKARDKTAGWPANNSRGISLCAFNESIKYVADAFGADIIDLHNCGLTYANIASFAVDSGLHPNAAGHALMANRIIQDLISKY